MKTLIVEGAGWSSAPGTNDVTNCRIRTRIAYKGQKVYFEAAQGREDKGFVWHCHIENNDNSGFRKFENQNFVWTKAGILEFVNQILPGAEFTELVVDNDGVCVHETSEVLC